MADDLTLRINIEEEDGGPGAEPPGVSPSQPIEKPSSPEDSPGLDPVKPFSDRLEKLLQPAKDLDYRIPEERTKPPAPVEAPGEKPQPPAPTGDVIGPGELLKDILKKYADEDQSLMDPTDPLERFKQETDDKLNSVLDDLIGGRNKPPGPPAPPGSPGGFEPPANAAAASLVRLGVQSAVVTAAFSAGAIAIREAGDNILEVANRVERFSPEVMAARARADADTINSELAQARIAGSAVANTLVAQANLTNAFNELYAIVAKFSAPAVTAAFNSVTSIITALNEVIDPTNGNSVTERLSDTATALLKTMFPQFAPTFDLLNRALDKYVFTDEDKETLNRFELEVDKFLDLAPLPLKYNIPAQRKKQKEEAEANDL